MNTTSEQQTAFAEIHVHLRRCETATLVLLSEHRGADEPPVAALAEMANSLRAIGDEIQTIRELLGVKVAPPEDERA
jgi:hypothetical protein